MRVLEEHLEIPWRVNLNTIFLIKLFSNQLQCDKMDTLQQRIEWWLVVVDRGGPIPYDVYDYSFAELFNSHRKAIDHECEKW